ncbi:MAG: outer membrane beta-barrel protein [Bacteroidales bacterium]|nr:outer membrane beta-barrel protein [Bacteroidales bacterium]
MKKYYLITLLLIFFTSLFTEAYAQAKISGQIKDGETREALIYCSLSVYNLQDSLITGGVSNDKGYFIIPLQRGSYNLVSSYIGYQNDTLTLNVSGKDQFLGNIKLNGNQNDLSEIEVKGSLYEASIDKEVVFITTKIRASTANTSDVLERINGLSFDRYNNSIKVDGDDHIVLLVNGLEKNQEYIRNLSPERIKEVEILRNPSGRYALEGYSAIINILLKSDYKGTEIYAENMTMINTDTKENNYFPTNNFSLTYNYTYDKLNIYAKASNSYTGLDVIGESKQEYTNGFLIENKPLNNENNLKTDFLSNTYTAGIDYYINPKHTISFESNISAFPSPRRNIDHNYNVIHSQDGVVTDTYNSQNVNNIDSKDFTNSLFYIFKIDNKNTLNADFTFSKYTDDYTNSIIQSNGFELNETGENKKDYTKFYLELNHTINDKSTLMVGYGNTWRQMDNVFTTKTRLVSTEDFTTELTSFSQTETRHKLYAYYSSKLGNKVSYKLGLAGEYSHPKSGEIDQSYFIYQPHLDLNISAHKMLNIKLKYRADSDYPSMKQVNPFTHTIDPYTIETGNPYLEPELTHKISARFRIMQGLISLEPYYHFSNNWINKVITPLDGNIFEYSYDNVGNYESTGFKINFNLPMFKQSLFLQSNADFFQSSISYNGKSNTVNDWVMNTQLLYINKKYHSVAGLNYQKGIKKLINAQGYEYYNTDYWLIFIQQPLLKNKMTVMLSYMLPIDFGVTYEQGSYIDTGLYRATTAYDISMLKNTLMLRLTYRFTKGKSVRNISKSIEKEIENKSKGIF